MKDVKPREELHDSRLDSSGCCFFKMPTVGAFSMAAHTHTHDAIEGIYVTRGSIKVYIDGNESLLTPGDFVLFRSRGVHSIFTEGEPKNDYYVFKKITSHIHNVSPHGFQGNFALRFSVFNPELKYIWKKDELEGSVIKAGLDRLITDESCKTGISEIGRIITGLGILEAVYRETESEFKPFSLSSPHIYRAIVYINEHFEDDIKEEDVAAKFGMSYAYFSRSFKAATGKKFRDYLIETRLNQAEQFIINTDLPIAHIATLCGYSNISHFIHIYKKNKGTTPLKARTSRKGEGECS